MDIFILIDYIEFSKEIEEEPTWKGLKEHKRMFWRDQAVKNIQLMLEESINNYGISDRRTIMLSQQRDKEIAAEQGEIYNQWLQSRLVKKLN